MAGGADGGGGSVHILPSDCSRPADDGDAAAEPRQAAAPSNFVRGATARPAAAAAAAARRQLEVCSVGDGGGLCGACCLPIVQTLRGGGRSHAAHARVRVEEEDDASDDDDDGGMYPARNGRYSM